MNESFCLLDEPWLAVRMHDGRVLELGLLELFERASEIGALAETSPTSLIAQYRLLLAITHRAITQAAKVSGTKREACEHNHGIGYRR